MSIGQFTFNGFDVVVLLILLVSLLIAVQRGFVREIMSLLALFIAGVISLFIWGQFRYAAQDFISPSWLADVALGAGTFILVYMLFSFILTKLFAKFDEGPTRLINRILGAAFGVFRGLVLAALGVMVLTASHRASNEAQDFRDYISENRGSLPPDIMEKMPESMRAQMEAPAKPLPDYLAGSTFYPLLNSIGNVIRGLPFAEMRSYADRIKAGELEGISQEILK